MDIISDSSSSTPVKQSLNDLIDVVGFDADLALTPNIKKRVHFWFKLGPIGLKSIISKNTSVGTFLRV